MTTATATAPGYVSTAITSKMYGTLWSLSPRERDVAFLVSEGLQNKEIARRLGIGLATVKSHVESVSEKLGKGTRISRVKIAIAVWNGTGIISCGNSGR